MTVLSNKRGIELDEHVPDVPDVPVGTLVPSPAERAARWTPAASVRAYVALTKPRVIELLLITTIPVMFLAERGVPPLPAVLLTLAFGTLSAGAANAINCYIDRDIDAKMRRTRRRPLARHQVTPARALIFG